ncbi:MAG: Rne/Rng family ribonuclease, partial [Nocardioides sp.]
MLEDHQSSDNPGTTPDNTPDNTPGEAPAPLGSETEKKPAARKAAAKKAPAAKKSATKKSATRKSTTKKAAEAAPQDESQTSPSSVPEEPTMEAPAKKSAARKTTAKKSAAKKSTSKKAAADEAGPETDTGATGPATLLFQAPDTAQAPARRGRKSATAEVEAEPDGEAEPKAKTGSKGKAGAKGKAGSKAKADTEDQGDQDQVDQGTTQAGPDQDQADSDDSEGGGGRRRRRRGGRRRRKSGDGEGEASGQDDDDKTEDTPADDSGGESGEGGTSRRRRRRRRAGDEGDSGGDDPANTVTRVRQGRAAEDQITALSGSTRLEAKKQRRREGREAGRRRAPIVSEAEFLARREAVDRVMVIRQREELTQIAVLEDKVLVEHYVARESQTSMIGNVYLGRVQNVLPSMEAAFIDIGKGRNAVLYAGEVNWDALGAKEGKQRKIEQVLKSGQSILVQVSKDPMGHKGARLTSQISLPGRFLVYVPDGTTSGISRKLPDTERNRLKTLLKEIVPDTAGVIVRTAAEGASEEELTLDVERLTARWSDIEARAQKGNAPQLLYGEPDLTLKVVRDLFTEDFAKLVVSGDDAWEMVDGYVKQVAPDLEERLERYTGDDDVFAAYRIDEQIAKGLDRKVWLPSGGSLVIDRTEAMTVVDVNTGKFTGSGGNLEETVTKNNLEAAEEIVRQLRLRDIGGIIVVDFIDMVLESNRDLVLRRLVECLGRDRTRHQVAEVTSLGLVQMTRKRIGTGLLEAFSESCEHCQGRGVLIHHEPVEPRKRLEEEPRRGRRGRNRSGDEESSGNGGGNGGTGGN